MELAGLGDQIKNLKGHGNGKQDQKLVPFFGLEASTVALQTTLTGIQTNPIILETKIMLISLTHQ